MPSLIAALALAQFSYGFSQETNVKYDVNVRFEGFLPVLGGNEGVVDVVMGVTVKGAEPKAGELGASSEITAFDLVFNGSKLPLTLENVTEFFPKTNVRLTPLGKILSNDAPNRKLPVRLPGLDVKRFPDITYIPLEFPEQGIELGRSWSFERDFGDVPLKYECKAEAVSQGEATIKVAVSQTYKVFENEALEIVEAQADAVREVETTMTGEGTVVVDRDKGVARSANMKNTATSVAKTIKTGEVAHRKLVTEFKVGLKGDGAKLAKAGKPRSKDDVWTRANRVGRDVYTYLQLAAFFGLAKLPQAFATWAAPFRQQIEQAFPWLANSGR